MHRAYEDLDRLYKSDKSKEEKLAEKAKLLAALQVETHFRRPLNNATLSAYRNYNAATPEFEALLRACDGKWERFFGTLGRLRKDGSFARPNQMELGSVLAPLVAAKCPS
jgi:predicted aminopeptidase